MRRERFGALLLLLLVVPGVPAQTERPPVQVSFYRLRLEYSTTSDWSTLEIKNPASVLSIRRVAVDGTPTDVETAINRLALNQPLSASKAGQRVGVTVDLAVAPEALQQPLAFLLQKGALRGSVVRVTNLAENNAQLVREISHQGAVPNNPAVNPLTFTVDLSILKNIPPRQAEIQRPRRMLWAFYYPWYRAGDWSSAQLKDRPATRYSSDDPAAIARQIEQAKGAGIDGFISSWWGPGDYTDKNLKRLLDLARERSFAVTIYFETLGDGGRPRGAELLTRWLTYLITTYRDHPAFMKVSGKPLIVLWASGAVPLATWQEVLAKLRAQGLDATYLAMGYDVANLATFDGLHEYGIFTIKDLPQTMAAAGRATRYYPLLADTPAPKIWAATVQPGYDDRLIPGRRGLFQDRQNGAFYRSTFDAALASDPDWIFITTWNEWWEHTYVEPSELYGDQYLKITREFADPWKGQ